MARHASRPMEGVADHLLARVSNVFPHVRRDTLRRLVQASTELDIPRARSVFRAGDPVAGVYVVLSGSIRLVARGPAAARPVTIALLRPGDVFDLLAVLLERPHATSAWTGTRTRLMRIQKDVLLDAAKLDSALSFQFARTLSGSIDQLLARVALPTPESAAVKMMKVILGELPRSVERGRATVTLPSSRRAIAASLQIRPEHVSRVLRQLSSSRLIAVNGDEITLPDVARAHRYLRGEDRDPPQSRRGRRLDNIPSGNRA